MTATMPEEDLDAAVKKAEKCRWGNIVKKNQQRCDSAATHELLLHCRQCRTVRVPLCDQHLHALEALPSLLCNQCGVPILIVGVMPL